MKFLYVPWRSKYVAERRGAKKEEPPEECIFCKKIADNNDVKHFILGRYKYNYVILNLHPYNTGHIMIIPFKHVTNLNDLIKDERTELMELISSSTLILQETLRPEGFNIGMNLGKAAGAGLPTHLHMHVLPRWSGDTNFLPLLAETKIISVDLNKLYQDLKPKFESIKFD